MAFSFPSNPALNDTYTYNSITWTFNGKGWNKASTGGGGASITVNPAVPATTVEGSTWLDNDTGDLYVYTGGNWLLVAGGGGSGGSYNDLTDKPTISPAAVSDQSNTSTGYFDLPLGTTAQRPVTVYEGATRVNTTTNRLEMYYNSAWKNLNYIGAIEALGGTVTTSGGYKTHVFTTSGQFNVIDAPAGSYIQYLIVAGGGGAGHSNGGAGGGAGGLLYSGNYSITSGNYAVTVGAGGAGSGSGSSRGANGSNSVFGSLTAIGGGGSGTESLVASNGVSSGSGYGAPGGSGGGSVRNSTANSGGRGTSGQGNNGGANINDGAPHYAGGGGGGAGAAGADGSASGAGAGGAGLYYSDFANYGSPAGWFAGGGGGGNYNNGSGGSGAAGGNGGGAPGGSHLTLTQREGIPNTGGGGGASGLLSGSGASGGSGIVIIRYAVAQ